jgi:tRNA A-37 threonylcarbamoyl transferase component Bud32
MASACERVAGGVRWHVADAYRDVLLGPGGLRLDEWLRDGRARVVKHGPLRTVYRVELPALSFHVKHYRLVDRRGWLRELVRPAKARGEYRKTLAVAARGVPTFMPLGFGEREHRLRPGDSYLLTRSIDEAVPLTEFVGKTLPRLAADRHARVRQRLAVALGRLMARLHGAGVLHNDLHAGNLLIHLDRDDRPVLYLIDLHAARLCRPLGWRARRANLVMLNRWFVVKASRSDRLRFWRAYAAAVGCVKRSADAPPSAQAPTLPSVAEASGASALRLTHPTAADLEERTWVSNRWFFRNRDRRCLASNKYYQRLATRGAGGTVTGHVVRDLDPDAAAELCRDPDGPFRRADAKFLKDSRSSTVVEMRLPVGGVLRPVIYKRFHVTARRDPWVSLVRHSAALRSWVLGHGLRERHLPTPRPLAVFHRRHAGLGYEGYLLTEKVADAVDLHGFVAATAGLGPARGPAVRAKIDQLARLVRELHRRQLSHRDLKASNVLVPPPGQAATGFDAWLIDLVGAARHRRLRRRRRVQDLARLNASFYHGDALTRTDRLRFLRVYLLWGLRGREGWKRWWREVAAATEAKAARNRRNARPLA